VVASTEFTIGGPRPFFARSIPIKFEAVFIRIAQIERFADAVVRRAIERNARALEAKQSVSQLSTRGIENR
jgi:hypothetical protein